MTDLAVTPAFLLASAAITLSPGPDILYVLAKGISQGRRSALVAAAGFCSGLSVHTTAAAVGLSAMLVASSAAFTAVKVCGAAYLVYLGIRAIVSKDLIAVPDQHERLPDKRIFAQAFVMNVLNPKVALFYLAFIPQFIPPNATHPGMHFMALGISFAVVALAIFSSVGVFSGSISLLIRSRPKLTFHLNRLAGLIFIALGVRLAI
ncbi:MAG: LysE family translocator [Nibricoccus sp.]